MENMDNFRERLESLEHQSRTLARQARWWRGIACGVGLLALVSLPLQSGTAADTQPRGMAERMAAVENKLSAMAFDDAANEVVISGANLRIVNGLGSTATKNGLGNLIVGYNELRRSDPNCQSVPTDPFCTDTRTGSHNVVVGIEQNFSSVGGLVIGSQNEISGDYASVSGGLRNTASGTGAAVSGGQQNTASGAVSSVSGGARNTASTAGDSVSGGESNIASGTFASVSGGILNTASGLRSSVSGGRNRTAAGEDDWVAGPLFADN